MQNFKDNKIEEQEERDKTTDIITAEDLAEQALYAATAPDCCSESERAKNMLGMLGANVSDETIYHDESEHYKKKVEERVAKEFELFKTDMTTNHTIDEVFYAAYEINVKSELKGTISEVEFDKEVYKALFNENGSILENLYTDFIEQENASVDTYGDTAEFIEGYCERKYPEIMSGQDIESSDDLVGLIPKQ